MKIRQGFVSNSSSSSFFVLISKEKHEQLLAQMHPYVASVLKALGAQQIKFLGHECLGFSYMIGEYGTFDNLRLDFKGENPFESPYDAMKEYEKAVKAQGGLVQETDF